jgi:hypothetical protein
MTTTTTIMTQPMSILTSHASTEWYTPGRYIEMVKRVLGDIELDPAGHPTPQRWIQAGRYWTQGGLELPWGAKTVFCNPPFGKSCVKRQGGGPISNQAMWSLKMTQEFEAGNFEQGILLVNSTHGYKWYEDLWVKFPVCCVRERIRFIKPSLEEGGQAKRGQTFVYMGSWDGQHVFKRVFGEIGRVIFP